MLEIIALPAFDDNYFWLLDDGAGHAAVVDPGAAELVESALAARALRLGAILITHHHPDHIGGVAGLLARRRIPVYGPSDSRIESIDHPVAEGTRLRLDAVDIDLTVWEVPGHTRSHLAYLAGDALFCGDTLFASGCGRLFEGTPAQMLHSLDRIAALPAATRAYPAHEYTLSNCRFALTVDSDNLALQRRYAEVQELRSRNLPSVPTSIAIERECNPFLRTDSVGLRQAFQHANGRPAESRVEVFAWLRKAKDDFRG